MAVAPPPCPPHTHPQGSQAVRTVTVQPVLWLVGPTGATREYTMPARTVAVRELPETEARVLSRQLQSEIQSTGLSLGDVAAHARLLDSLHAISGADAQALQAVRGALLGRLVQQVCPSVCFMIGTTSMAVLDV